MFPVQVTSNIEIATGVFILSIPRKFDFLPGQVIEVTTHFSLTSRMYSICSGKDDDMIRILYHVRNKGQLTPQLAKLKPDDKLFVSQPSGQFTCEDGSAVWIAGGTGIAPFASMVLSGQGNHKILLHGARNGHGFYFRDIFEKTEGLQYLRCASDDNDSSYHGRVSDYILSNLFTIPVNNQFYLCSSADMVDEVRESLIKRGVPITNIIEEIFY
jgi:ferredoxin--NADP+ reductase